MHDPFGFLESCKDLEVRLKSGGLGRFGDVMRPNQREFLELVADYRRRGKRTQFIWFKARQWAAMTTTVAAAITGDNRCNPGFNAIVTAQDADSLDEISQVYRHFYGRTKKAGVEQGRAERLADRLFVATNGSRTKLQVADEDLGRSGNATGLHVSEAGYISDFVKSWESMQPALSGAPTQLIVMETTLRRGMPSDLQTIAEEIAEGKHAPWEVHFTSWWANPELTVPMNAREEAAFLDECPIYERELMDRALVDDKGAKLRPRLSVGQAKWYYDTRVGGMFGSYEAMHEAYPTTKKEAMSSVRDGGFFRREAMQFYASCIRPPIYRWVPELGKLRDWQEGDSPLQPHVEVWRLPEHGRHYLIAADCADADERQAVEGSENAAVLIDEDTGDVCAVYHGYCNSHEFAAILVEMATRYNNAWLNPEFNNAGRAVVDHILSVLNYYNIRLRENFRAGIAVGTISGQFGFLTTSNSRGIMLDRLQMGINNRMWGIPSQYVLDCLKALAKRNGQRVHKRGDASVKPDDGAIALALTAFTHDKLVGRYWKPKQPYEPAALPPGPAPKRHRILIEQEPVKRLRFDPVSNTWR